MEDDFVLGKISPINKIEVTSFINGWAQIILFICLHGAYAIIGSKKQPKKIKDSVHLVVFSGRAIREMLDGVIHPQFPFKNVAEYSDEFTRSYLSAYLKKPERLKFVYLYFERFVRYIVPEPKRNGLLEKLSYLLKSFEDIFSKNGNDDVLMDQLIVLRKQVAEQLKNAIASNRHQIITWQPHIDMDNESPPCLQRIWIRVYPNGDVDIHLDWRSRDAYTAYIVNLIGLIRMLYREVIAPNGCTIVRVIDYCDSLHVYVADLDAARRVKEVDLRKIVFNPQLMCREGYECVYAQYPSFFISKWYNVFITIKFKNMKLENKVAVVTGASSGIGKAIAEKFVSEGVSVVFSDINECDVSRFSDKAIFVKCDVSKSSDVDNLIKSCVDKFNKIDIMVNNAGIGSLGDILTTSDDVWHKTIEINLSGVFFGIRAAGRVMKEKGIKGSIINMASILGTVGFNGAISYCAAKGGVNQLTKASAVELSKLGIRVNSIAPGFIKTSMTKGVQEDQKLLNIIDAMTPLGYLGEPDDIANAAVYLASEDSKYVTGSVMYVDGGWTAQ